MAQVADFGIALAGQLRRHGWSQRKFAAQAGEHQSLVVRVAGGQRRPPLDRLERWCAVLQLSAAETDGLIGLALAAHGAGWIATRLQAGLAQAAEPDAVYAAGRRRPAKRPATPSSPDRRRS